MALSLATALLGGLFQIALYADADQLDSGYHFLFARWSWRHADYLLSVWARPLFTLVYSLPAQFGYSAARLFTLFISLLTAHQTWRLARHLGLPRAHLTIPLLLAQPVFWQLSTGVYTESLFALFLVAALRLKTQGRHLAALLTASTLILIRPEGLFIGLFWGVWHLTRAIRSEWRGSRNRKIVTAAAESLLLASGVLIWEAAAWLITGDPLWILHNWPPDWNPGSKANGTGPIWWYLLLLPMITGPFMLPSFVSGLRQQARRTDLLPIVGIFLTIFIVHSVLYSRGWFGAAGYARYFVCVSPVTALIVLVGWSGGGLRVPGRRRERWRTGLLIASLLFSFLHVDLLPHGRDSRAISEMYLEFSQTEASAKLPINLLITSQPAMRIVFGRDHWEMPGLTSDRHRNLELIRRLPAGTLVFWDARTGPDWYHLTAADFVESGFVPLLSRDFLLTGRLLPIQKVGTLGARLQSFHLIYRSPGQPPARVVGSR